VSQAYDFDLECAPGYGFTHAIERRPDNGKLLAALNTDCDYREQERNCPQFEEGQPIILKG
jgi:hypothetical protein